MRYSRVLLCAAALLAPALRADSLDEILQRMDAAAKRFKSVSAKLHQVTYNQILKESSPEDAELRLRHNKGALTGILEFNPPDQRTVAFIGNKVEEYRPTANQVTVFDAGKSNMAKIDQFLLIAFGATSGTELRNAYDIKFAGTETIDSAPASHLVLIPKAAEAKKLTTMIELWFPDGKTVAAREKITQPDKDYIVNTWSEVKVTPPSPSLPDSAYELKLPPGVKVITQH